MAPTLFMSGCVAGYAKHHQYLGSPEQRDDAKKPTGLYNVKGKNVRIIKVKRKKYPLKIKPTK